MKNEAKSRGNVKKAVKSNNPPINEAELIYEKLKKFLGHWSYVNFIKDEYSLKDINKLYADYGKKYIKYRRRLHKRILADQRLYKKVRELAAKEFLFDILIDGWSYDINRVAAADRELGFLPFPHQMKLIDALDKSEKGVHVEKARRQGASAIMGLYMFYILKHETNRVMYATHKDLSSLDGGSSDIGKNSTMQRLRWLLKKSIFVPRDWDNKKKYWNKARQENRAGRYDKLRFADKQKEIVVGTNVIHAQVLGKGTATGFAGDYFFGDEVDVVSDMYPNSDKEIFGSFSSAINRVMLYSTYRSADYSFYRMKEKHNDQEWDFIELDWRDNPVCNDSWYRYQSAKLAEDEVLIARELDRDPFKARKGLVFGDAIDGNNLIERPPDLNNAFQWKKIVMADFGGGESATAFIFGYIGKINNAPVMYLDDVVKTTEMNELEIYREFKVRGFEAVTIAGDRSVTFQTGTAGHDWYTLLKDVGLKVKPVKNTDMHRIRAFVKRDFRDNLILININNKTLQKDLRNASYKKGDIDKNDYSHITDAVCYGYRDTFFPSVIGWR